MLNNVEIGQYQMAAQDAKLSKLGRMSGVTGNMSEYLSWLQKGNTKRINLYCQAFHVNSVNSQRQMGN